MFSAKEQHSEDLLNQSKNMPGTVAVYNCNSKCFMGLLNLSPKPAFSKATVWQFECKGVVGMLWLVYNH